MKGRNHKQVPGLSEEQNFKNDDLTLAETIVTWIFKFLCAGFLLLMLTGCGAADNTNPELQIHNIRGVDALVEIPNGEYLYFDYTTGIVYWWNGLITYTIPTPYYSPNGLLYRYIPETGELEEVLPFNVTEKMEGE